LVCLGRGHSLGGNGERKLRGHQAANLDSPEDKPMCVYSVKEVKEVDLCSAFIVVPHTQGARVRITQCYLQITPYLPLPQAFTRWRIPRLRLRTSNCSLLLIYLPPKG